MKIEFSGNLTQACKKELKKAYVQSCVKYVIIISLFIAVGCINLLTYLKTYTNYVKWFPLIGVVCGIIMCVAIINSSKKGFKEPSCIKINNDNCVSAVFDGNEYFWSFDDISNVRDNGDCYVMEVKSVHNISFLVCQKDLLTCGTLNEFEQVFHTKLKI